MLRSDRMVARAERPLPAGHGPITVRGDSGFYAVELMMSLLLGPGVDSSAPGLHFLGAPSALSFGPISRFVVGTWYAAPALTRRILGRAQRPISFSF